VEVVFRVESMDCGNCARKIQDRLCTLPGVHTAQGTPVNRRLRVLLDPGQVDAESIRDEVGRLGYAARLDGGDRASTSRAPNPWTGPDAIRTWIAGALTAGALLLRVLGGEPVVVRLALHELHPADLVFIAAALVGGWNFFPKGVRAAMARALDMNFLMTVAILGAVVVGETLEAASIAFLFSLAELLEGYSVDRARRSIESLFELAPEAATVVVDGREVRRYVEELRPGDEVVVRPGERIPVDGRVEDGSSAVDQAPVTGESIPVEKGPGDEVFAGTINAQGHLRVRVEKAAGDTTLARMIRLVEEAEGRRTRSERFVERFARVYTPAVTVGALLVAFGPPLVVGAPFTLWFVRGLTLLVIACPCALVISTPVAVVSGVTAAARNGVLIKGGAHLEAMGEVEVVAFDKTGTLTRGHPEVVDVVPAPGAGLDASGVLRLAAALERHSEHPLARAVVHAAAERASDGPVPEVRDFLAVPGRGVQGVVDGRSLLVGRPEQFDDVRDLVEDLHRLRAMGRTVVAVGPADRPLGLIALMDQARDGAADVVASLRRAGARRIVMLTGDNAETAAEVAAAVGVDAFEADLLPEQKVDAVLRLEREFGRVAMVGDGVNDGPALAAASVGVAMGAAGSDVAIETADVALMGDDLSRLPYLMLLSRRSRRVIRQNIGASIALKATLALGVPLGWVSLILAVVAGDMGASLGVTSNALRLGRVRP